MADKLDIKAFLDKDEQKDLLRLLTAGSVDDGKSTLIGRCCSIAKNCMRISLMHWSVIASGWAMPANTLIMPCCWMA